MNKRIVSIDILRGVTIFLMVLSANIAWNSGLPAWMFHCQVPPPDFVFNPDVKGITWVDLVFPFFIFTMGASMPFSLGGKLRKGISVGRVSLDIVKRWIILAAFGLVLGNANAIFSYEEPLKVLTRFGIWIGLFLALWRIPQKGKVKPWMINLAGALVVVALLAVVKFGFGAKLAFSQNNIIIMILSLLALLGGFIWLLTKEKPWLRLLIFIVACVAKELAWHTDVLKWATLPAGITWLLNWRYAQYLVITLIGMSVGDILMRAKVRREAICIDPQKVSTLVSALLCLVIVPVMLWAFYSRHIQAGMIIAIAFAIAQIFLTRDCANSPKNLIARMGYLLLVLGLLFDPIDGGITKDHCNLSYLLSTGGLACLLISFLLWCEGALAIIGGKMGRGFALVGQNPMLAYTLSGLVLNPIFYMIGLGAVVDSASAGNPFMGLVRGFIITLAMMAVTCVFSKHKIYWRS